MALHIRRAYGREYDHPRRRYRHQKYHENTTRLGDLDLAASNPFKSVTGTPWTSDSAKAIAK